MSVLLVSLFTVLQPQKSYATTIYGDNCRDGVNGTLDAWDWPTAVKNYSTHGLSSFDMNNSSFIIYRTPTQKFLADTYSPAGSQTAPANSYGIATGTPESSYPNNTWNMYQIGFSRNDSRLVLYGVPTDEKYGNTPTSLSELTIVDGSITAYRYIGSGNTFTTNHVFSSAYMACTEVAHNVDYADNWHYDNRYASTVFSGTSISCATFDIGCYIGVAFNGVTETFKSVGQAILRGLGALYIPDGDVIKGYWNSFYDNVQDELGLLTFPIDFMADVFNSFSTSSSWCSSSSCTKNFGNLFGHATTINFIAIKSISNDYWVWFTTFVQGATVIALLLMLRNKWLGMMRN